MCRRIGKVISLWICVLCVSACGSFEIGIEHVPPESSVGEVNWQATAEALQAEATRLSGNMQLPSPLTVAEVTPTLVPVPAATQAPIIVPAAHEQPMLAYVQGGDIWVKALPDGEATRLTQNGRSHSPRWSASGEWLSFLENWEYPVLWVMRNNGENASALGGITGDHAWSPVEDKLALGKGAALQQFIFEPDGTFSFMSQIDLPAQPETYSTIDKITWSPDGQRLAFTLMAHTSDGSYGQDGLWTVDIAGNVPEQILAGSIPDHGEILLHSWSGDGEYLLYWQAPILSASILSDGVPLYRVPAQGGTPQALAESVLYHEDAVQSQPQGLSQVAVVVGSGREMWHGKRLNSYVVNGMQQWELTPPDQSVTSPAWSLDGSSIAYSGAPDVEGVVGGPEAQAALNLRQIWISDPNAPEPHKVTGDAHYREEAPQWIDYDTLLFARIDFDGRVSLLSVDTTGENEQLLVDEITPAPEWFGYYGHIDWSQYFALWRPTYITESAIAHELVPTFVPLHLATSNIGTLAGVLHSLNSQLTLEQAIALWGEPEGSGGSQDSPTSGVLRYLQYTLADGLRIRLGFPEDGPLAYVQLQSADGRAFVLSPLDEYIGPATGSAVATPPSLFGTATATPFWSPVETPTPTPASMDAVTATPLPTLIPAAGDKGEATAPWTPTFTPVATPAPTATPVNPLGTPIVIFYAEDEELEPEECTTVVWHVENVTAVYYDSLGVNAEGQREECVHGDDGEYNLTVMFRDGVTQLYTVTVGLVSASSTPVPTPTRSEELIPTRTPASTPVVVPLATPTPFPATAVAPVDTPTPEAQP